MDMRNQFQSKHSKHVAYDQTTKCYNNRNIDMKVFMPDLGNMRSVQMQVWYDFKKKVSVDKNELKLEYHTVKKKPFLLK